MQSHVRRSIESMAAVALTAVFANIWYGDAATAASGSSVGGAWSNVTGLIVLDGTASGALTLSGSARVEAPSARVDSSSLTAVKTSGSATLDVKYLYVAGGTSFGSAGGCTGEVTALTAAYPDPLAALNIPTAAGATDLGTASVGSSKTVTIAPGYYSGGITASSSATLTLSPGVYLIGGTGLKISSSAHLVGDGVALVLLEGGVTFSGGSSAKLTPATTGELAGVVIAQPSSNASDLTLSGGDVSVGGHIYVPAANATLKGSSKVAGDSFIARTVTMSGSAMIKIGKAAWNVKLPSPPGQYD